MSKFARFRCQGCRLLFIYGLAYFDHAPLHSARLRLYFYFASGAEIPWSEWALLDILANTLAVPYHAT